MLQEVVKPVSESSAILLEIEKAFRGHIPNVFSAFTGNAGMIAVESGVDRIGHWVSESRDVLADYRRLFGEEPGRVDAVAIMTDTDNTGAATTAWYGDIWFAAK